MPKSKNKYRSKGKTRKPKTPLKERRKERKLPWTQYHIDELQILVNMLDLLYPEFVCEFTNKHEWTPHGKTSITSLNVTNHLKDDSIIAIICPPRSTSMLGPYRIRIDKKQKHHTSHAKSIEQIINTLERSLLRENE